MFIDYKTRLDLDNYNKELWFIDYSKITDIDNLPGEIWKDIGIIDSIDFTGYYQESNYGRTKSLDRYVMTKGDKQKLCKGRILKPFIYGKSKYYRVVLAIHGNNYNKSVHRLVGFVFVKNDDPEHKTFINHKDENKLNNTCDNLEWCTPKYNINYGSCKQKISEKIKQQYADGTKKLMKDKIPVVQLSLSGEYINQYPSARDTGNKKYKNSMIQSCCTKRKKTAYGFIWMYLKDYTPENVIERVTTANIDKRRKRDKSTRTHRSF